MVKPQLDRDQARGLGSSQDTSGFRIGPGIADESTEDVAGLEAIA